MTSAEEDYYELLGIESTATLKEIKRAYRRKALLCHPDKAGPDDAKAAELFHRLTKADDVLSNPESRARYDDLHKSRRLQQARFKEMDTVRQKAKQDLNEREMQAAKRQKTHNGQTLSAEAQKSMAIEQLREEGFRRMQALESEKRQTAVASVSLANSIDEAKKAVEKADLIDCTLKIKWKKPATFTEDAIRECILKVNSQLRIEKILMGKASKSEANVVFKDLYSAYAVIKAKQAQHDCLDMLTIKWSGSPPMALAYIDTAAIGHELFSSTQNTSAPFPSFVPMPSVRQFTATSFPMKNPCQNASLDNYEERTLRKMRQQEREIIETENS
ncbi:hypothetical protein BATDEDRAFT_88729 [Batrachochytrium dendrobatidis JAM81]|uniref:J domain-containing protein n=1 Tax=Batrachochytrium dendrobatidis (strain JAM81 / FGSC 10211) TaxID=684364 RepID=F4P2Z7_BATDJ|nr:uncharacterized protein BATDEDRAFT_88729 [Batrachochytrium dendrobatidis JAM81]EGF80525.1 hypothetical protein BATDEDRAFT_88729 [Batrachochytrium dendrobatidis JAM81]|eukprot:XP_006679310.1 hypothetical protein BATDEDRAFT_88729 [Batrachochytrium dendrobatidis JAM81]